MSPAMSPFVLPVVAVLGAVIAFCLHDLLRPSPAYRYWADQNQWRHHFHQLHYGVLTFWCLAVVTGLLRLDQLDPGPSTAPGTLIWAIVIGGTGLFGLYVLWQCAVEREYPSWSSESATPKRKAVAFYAMLLCGIGLVGNAIVEVVRALP